MARWRGGVASLLLTFLLTGAVRADVTQLIVEGRYVSAYEQALERAEGEERREARAAMLVQAATAANLQATYHETEPVARSAWFARAAEAAQQAVELDPQNAEAHFQLARALGQRAAYLNLTQQLSLVNHVRSLLQRTLELEPDHAEARMALALWHLELAKSGMGWLYGARMEAVRPLFEEALALEPERLSVRVEYGATLERLGDTDAAREAYQAALAVEPQSAQDRYEQERALERLEAL